MKVKWFKGKRVTVFGIGLLGGGVGVIRFLVENGAEVIATDIRPKNELTESLAKIKGLKNVTYILGHHRREDFMRVDMVVKTPSCPWTNEHIKLAREYGVPVETDASLFLQLCKNPVIGITGTKGKTTVSRLIDHIIDTSGHHALQVGVGTTPVLNRLKLLKRKTIVVFELSSWRLSALRFAKVSPHIAVFTNFFPDHMNYYKTMDAYLRDKSQIFLHQSKKDFIIYNADDESVRVAVQDAKSVHVPVSTSVDHVFDARLFLDDGHAWMRNDNVTTDICSLADVPLRGVHNHINILLAIGAAEAIGIPLKKIANAVKTFVPVRHRLERVRVLDDVTYYNDTAATNPDAAIAALRSFGEPIILLAGGADKNLATKAFAQEILAQTKDVVFFKGRATDKIITHMRKIAPDDPRGKGPEILSNMNDAIAAARARATKGDIVLLSPGAASFGIFKNEFDRGDQFRAIVKAL